LAASSASRPRSRSSIGPKRNARWPGREALKRKRAPTRSGSACARSWRRCTLPPEERRAAAEHYRSVAVAGADQLERIAQVSYDAGERGILELLDAYRLAASARVRLSSLDFAAREAEVELEFVSGWEIP
jgi:cobalt-zinc-cadmium efflux system outer membrane protein